MKLNNYDTPVHAITDLRLVLTANRAVYDLEPYQLVMSYCPVSKNNFWSVYSPRAFSITQCIALQYNQQHNILTLWRRNFLLNFSTPCI